MGNNFLLWLKIVKESIHYFEKGGNQTCILVFLFKLCLEEINKHWRENIILRIISANKE